jgi:hypothetical protein
MEPASFASEDDFQKLLSRFPELLVGDEIDPPARTPSSRTRIKLYLFLHAQCGQHFDGTEAYGPTGPMAGRPRDEDLSIATIGNGRH